MNIAREGLETIIDPLFPITNAPATSAIDFGMHIVIVAIEIAAFVVVWNTAKTDKQA